MAIKYFCISLFLIIIFFTLTPIKTSARPSMSHSTKNHKPTSATPSMSHSVETQKPTSSTPSTFHSIKTHKPTSATPSTSHSIKTQKPTEQDFKGIIESLKGARDFSKWAVVLSTTDPSNFPISATLFIPSDNALSNITAAQFLQFDSLTLSYHVVPQKIPFSLLQKFKIGSRIPTLLPNKTILVTNNSVPNYTIDDSQITHPDLYSNGEIAVHGIGSLLNYSVFGGGFDEDHHFSDPFSPDDDLTKPMGPDESNGWRFTAKDISLVIFWFAIFWMLQRLGILVLFLGLLLYLSIFYWFFGVPG